MRDESSDLMVLLTEAAPEQYFVNHCNILLGFKAGVGFGLYVLCVSGVMLRVDLGTADGYLVKVMKRSSAKLQAQGM